MSWTTDIKYIMGNDASLNDATGGIYFQHLPDDANLENDYIVYTYNRSSEVNSLQNKNLYTEYNLNVIIISQSPFRLNTLSEMASEYLNNAEYNGIVDITFKGDDMSSDLDEDIYQNTLEFSSIYN